MAKSSYNPEGFILVCTVVGSAIYFALFALLVLAPPVFGYAPGLGTAPVKLTFALAVGLVYFYIMWNHIPAFTRLVWDTKKFSFVVAITILPWYAVSFAAPFLSSGGAIWTLILLIIHVLAGFSLALLFLPGVIMWGLATNGLKSGRAKTAAEMGAGYRRDFVGLVISALCALMVVLVVKYLGNASGAFYYGAHLALFIVLLCLNGVSLNGVEESDVTVVAPFKHISDLGKEERASSIIVPFAVGALLGGLCVVELVIDDAGLRVLAPEVCVSAIGICINAIGLYRVLDKRKSGTFYTSIKYLILAQGIIAACLVIVPEYLYAPVIDLLVLEGLFCVAVLFGASSFSAGKADLSPLYFVARSLYRVLIGAALGGLFVFGVATYALHVFNIDIVSVVCLLVVVISIYSFTRSIDDFADDLPQDDPASEEGASLPVENGIDAEGSTPEQQSDLDRKIAADYPRWKRRCAAVAEEYSLTHRETEVLMMLAKGRNAQFIAESLVISLNTVKTHIYRIYKKLDVQSRQELITLIEEEGVAEPSSLSQ